MKHKYLFLMSIATVMIIASCGPDQVQTGYTPTNTTMKEPGDTVIPPVVVDYSKGEGKFTDVKLTHPLDQKMAARGQSIYNVKCSACHKLTDEKLVGPGWKGVTDRRKPEWIMNFATNTDEMIDKDPAVVSMLEKCIVRMPNQHLSSEDAREVLEFMRSNDGKN